MMETVSVYFFIKMFVKDYIFYLSDVPLLYEIYGSTFFLTMKLIIKDRKHMLFTTET